MKYSKGICWISDCRIPFVDEGDIKSQARAFTDGSSSHKGQAWNNHLGWEGSKGEANPTNTQGRFTPNLLVCDDMLNDGNIYKSGDGKGMSMIKRNGNTDGVCKMEMGYSDKAVHYGDSGTSSRYYDLDKWFDKVIDEIQ